MSLIQRNIAANYIGVASTAITALLVIPLYIKILGIEYYGLIGFFSALIAVSNILDVGLSTTMNRELARLSAHRGGEQQQRDTVRTLETVYWLIAIVVGLLVVFLSRIIATQWIRAGQIAPNTLQPLIVLMGIALVFNFPISLYMGGLNGLQRQVLTNGIVVISSLVRGGGGVAILLYYSPTIQAFFVWNLIAYVFQTFLLAFFLWWRALPRTTDRAKFQKKLFQTTWRFTAGIALVSILGVVLTQLSNVILPRIVPLSAFGYYSVAAVLAASAAGFVGGPLFNALFPRLSQLVAHGDVAALKSFYHHSCEGMSVLVLPVAATFAFFSPEVLLIWTRDPTIVNNCSLVLSFLIVGYAINAIMLLPFGLQIAYGWTRLLLGISIAAVVFAVPLTLIFANVYGIVGAASVWVIVNSYMFLIQPWFMHRRILKNELMHWYAIDVGLPLIPALVIPICARFLISVRVSSLILILELCIVLSISMLSAGLLTPATRTWIQTSYTRLHSNIKLKLTHNR
jgi:O-antigen/teichoic acid export membrane protein